jgi:bifunctional UDP-N-acetylglucosamine pyrophosphorylase/glucosamine-1-phosphate N-acetyltransferase
VAAGAVVGPDTTLIDTTVGAGATVLRTHSIGAEVGPAATVGPFSFLRPGTRLARKSKVGGFVETKNAELGEGAKVPHLSYVGDASIGAKANIGAGTIFANYDGVNKHHTVVGEAAFVGSDTVLIAPVEVGPGAYVAAGSAIAKEVPPGNLGVTRAQQRNVEGWTARRRAGTVSAAAAEKAAAEKAAAARSEAGQSAAGQPAAGQPAAEKAAAGQSAVGRSAAGQSAAGQSVAGQSVAGQSVAGQTAGENA